MLRSKDLICGWVHTDSLAYVGYHDTLRGNLVGSSYQILIGDAILVRNKAGKPLAYIYPDFKTAMV